MPATAGPLTTNLVGAVATMFLVVGIIGCDRSENAPLRKGDHDLVSQWEHPPEMEAKEMQMQEMWRSYCRLPASTRSRSTLYAILSNQFYLSCHRYYPDDDSDVCQYIDEVGAMSCDYVMSQPVF